VPTPRPGGPLTSRPKCWQPSSSSDSPLGVSGLLLLDLERRGRRPADDDPDPGGPHLIESRSRAVASVAHELVGSIVPPCGVPREVLALGVWSDTYVEQRGAERTRWLRDLAGRLAMAEGVTGDEDSTAAYGRALTLVHRLDALLEQTWMVAALVLPARTLDGVTEAIDLLIRLLFAPTDQEWELATSIPDMEHVPVERAALTGHSDRHAATVAELREATRLALVADGLDLQAGEIAASVHRSHAAFFDTFGSVGGALADLAAAQQVSRIPTRLFRPRADVGPQDLIEHLVWRINAWQDAQGLTGRRLHQIAGRDPEVAGLVVDQTRSSAELLLSWYGPMFRLPQPLTRLVLMALLTLPPHQVLWGAPAPVVTGASALAALLAPVMVTDA
jgi:hypothetical protein